MRVLLLVLCLACAACGVAHQPESIQYAAAFEVPLPTRADKQDFTALLQREAEAHGFHVDVTAERDLRTLSSVSAVTYMAGVWRGENDEENVASAMDFETHLGRVWLTFSTGTDPERYARFRSELMPKIRSRWPDTASLPIMPTGAIPLDSDLVMTPAGYEVKASEAHKYQAAES